MGWEETNARMQEQARITTEGKRPSLQSQYNYYLEQSQNTDHSAKDRKLWKQLADEIGPRIKPKGETSVDTEQLF
jgi:hypothetical protein